MISFFETEIVDVFIHRIGNKIFDEGKFIAETPASFDEGNQSTLKHMFLSGFAKTNFAYKFINPNSVVNTAVFGLGIPDHVRSATIANHLYETSDHPKIKCGELFTVEFANVQYRGDLHSAIGIFKSENKETFFKSQPSEGSFIINFENQGVSIDRLDKGALILDNGTVLCYDNDKTGYWKDQFLEVEVLKDDFSNTSNTLDVIKEFITHKLDEEFEVASTDKVDLLNKSIKYFKEKESFDVDEFCAEVIGNEEASTKFKSFRSIYGEEFDELPDSFNISTPAVKKQSASFKKVIKLDKNFHIYVHGNKDLIQKGYDEQAGMNFYKVFYKEEA
jgi:hypothetical protein